MKISIRDLRLAADWLETQGARYSHPEDHQSLYNAADYLRFVADQREEYEARQREPDERMEQLKVALQKVWSARGARAAGRAG